MKRFLLLLPLLLLCFLLAACEKQPPPDPLAETAAAVLEGNPPDFASLQKQDPSIIAWLCIPGADISQPVYAGDSGVHTDPVNGDVRASAPVILLFGGADGQGAPFRTLQSIYSADSSLWDASTVLLYTPEGLQTWDIFGAGAFRDIDILNIYDSFRNRKNIPWFVDQWQKHHTMIRVIDDGVSVTEDDRLLILSTDLNQTPGQRFLVLALSVDETG